MAKEKNIRDIIEYEEQGISPDVLNVLREEQLPIPLNTPGRYLPLDTHTADRIFYRHFGLHMRVHEFIEGSSDEYLPTAGPNERTTIDVFLKNGHFELQKHSKLPQHDYKIGLWINSVPTRLFHSLVTK